MKNSIIIRTLVLASLALFSCNKVENTPPTETQKLSLSDSVTAKPNLKNTDKDATAEKIAHYITNDYLKPDDLKTIGMKERKFHYQQIDLNDDGKKEIFVGFYTPYFCGTGGCSMVLLDEHLKPITKFTVTRPPIYADPTTDNGWSILYLKDGNHWKALVYKDGKYPSNPSTVPKSSRQPSEQAVVIFPENISKEYQF